MNAAAPRIQLLVVQPTPFCNIDCRYCYLPDRTSKAVMADETLRTLFRQVFESGWAEHGLNVVWHAGEPMVLPIEYYRKAFRLVDELKPSGQHVMHSFQTNGTLIDDAWCDFFHEAKINLGVSIDGPQPFHDRNRVTRAGRGTFDKTIAGIRRLRRRQVPFHVISVLTWESLAAPREMFEFYAAEGIEQVCFNVEESEGSHVSEAFAKPDFAEAYYRFLGEFWRLCSETPSKIAFVREIDVATRNVLRPKDVEISNDLTEPFAVTSVDWSGNVSTFSPELLGLKNAEYGDFIIGNINRERLTDMAERPVFLRMKADIEAGVALCRERCEYFSVCGGGEPVNKLFENGTFVSAETAYCRMTRMRATDLVLDLLDRVELKAGGEIDLARLGQPSSVRPLDAASPP